MQRSRRCLVVMATSFKSIFRDYLKRYGMLRLIFRISVKVREKITRRWYREMLFSRCQYSGGAIVVGPDVWWNFHFSHPEKIIFGEGTVMNGECYINAHGGVVFGRYCHVGKGLTIFSSNHNYKSTFSIPYGDDDILKSVSIGDCVWIGANVNILPGTSIGDGAIISMGSVVRGAVPSGAIVAGNPAKIVGYRDMESYRKLSELKAFV
ncbi:acyltransferase [Chromobacterium alticapitis]|uniref:Acyltransferase n=2 Tax=Chromobacterium alticapitis TaxID=2073169 RepID=A0A2S5DCS7_9NEIS|nr:acyltransferase [Chromobacterium alticapitis]